MSKKGIITIQSKLLPNKDQLSILDNQCRIWSSCMRYAYQRLLEGKERNELKRTSRIIVRVFFLSFCSFLWYNRYIIFLY